MKKRMRRRSLMAKVSVALVVLVFAAIGLTLTSEASNNQKFLSDCYDYGIVCNDLFQTADVETNFAVCDYYNNGHTSGNTVSADKANAAGSIIVGQVHGELKTRENPVIYKGEEYKQTVKDMIASVKSYSETAVKKEADITAPEEVKNMNSHTIDISGESADEVYVNADALVEQLCNTQIQSGGLTLRMRKSQSIVLNTTKAEVVIPEYKVEIVDGSKEPVEIAETVIWNMPKANKLDFTAGKIRGTYIAPDAYVNISATVEGWLVCSKVITTGNEWHMISKKVPATTPTPKPTSTPEVTPTSTPEVTPTATPEVTPTATPEATATPTPTPKATPSPTPKATATPTPKPTPSPTPKATATPTPKPTPSPTPKVTPKATATPTPKPTPSPTPKATATPTPKATPSPTPKATATPTPKPTPSPTPKATATPTPKVTPTATPKVTPTATPKVTPTATPEVTPTATPEVTPTATSGVTSTPTAAPSETPGTIEVFGATSTPEPTVTPCTTKELDEDTPLTTKELDEETPLAKASSKTKKKTPTVELDEDVPLADAPPETGDSVNLLIPLVVMGVSLLAIVLVFVMRRRKS